ncbi:hypothetical protein V7S76_09145 [Aquirufa sp. ROCK2-A2]
MEFDNYLASKKIDASSFKEKELDRYNVWKIEFEMMHETSFTDQKKFQINKIRRKYTLASTENIGL